MKPVRIGSERCGYVRIGPGLPCAVTAELGLNHDGRVEKAIELVELAHRAGANLIKFQYINPAAMVSRESLPELYSIYEKYSLTLDEMGRVFRACEKIKIPPVCTVFDLQGAARMFELGVCAFKVASCDMTHLPMLKGLGAFGLPVILSTGLSDLAEVAAAVRTLKRGDCKRPVLLHCVSAYPAPSEEINLTAMTAMRRKFKLPVGFSDHTPGALAPALAAVLGACMVEKHFTYDPQAGGPDHALSLGPEDFRGMVEGVRNAEAMRGDGRKKPAPSERKEREVGRRGFYLKRDVSEGEKVLLHDLAALKPWTDAGPYHVSALRGARYARPLKAGSPLTFKDITLRSEGE
ncbi:MAG: N-acetylneuraminate synthase family protein [Gemmatimonadota bacterium]|nr:N-acetylneuraminate synthase family protein [Gemmatimonadota bacterium]